MMVCRGSVTSPAPQPSAAPTWQHTERQHVRLGSAYNGPHLERAGAPRHEGRAGRGRDPACDAWDPGGRDVVVVDARALGPQSRLDARGVGMAAPAEQGVVVEEE